MSGNSALFPKAGYAAVGTINAAIVALAKAFSDRGIADGVQVNSVLPGPVMTGRRRSYLVHWAEIHNMSVEEATAKFPKDAGIARYGEPEEIAELMAFLVSPGARWMTGTTLRMDGGRSGVGPSTTSAAGWLGPRARPAPSFSCHPPDRDKLRAKTTPTGSAEGSFLTWIGPGRGRRPRRSR